MNSRPDNNEKRMDTPLKMIKTLHLSNYLCSISIRPKNSSNYSNAALFSTALHIQDQAAVARVLQRSAAAVIRPLCSSAADVVTCPACSRWRRPVDPHEPYTPPSVHSTSCNMPSLLRHLSTWHCPHLLLSAILRRCCWATGGLHMVVVHSLSSVRRRGNHNQNIYVNLPTALLFLTVFSEHYSYQVQ